ncbi:ribonuclease III [Hyphomicrobium sp. CS1GBMeth3]|uniref:ribonuclease III n=1 Tax=Hyphomicrobium sp. CS1GBMeth3 TaxID=1892845 RepID=UPI00093124DA|nr:ribonuclease III [Hyphomicrobium sp. CS1GBMeth3]
MFKARKYKVLEKKLGYRFKNEALLARALTHASLRGARKVREDNERLEFVGDRVLGLAIVELLEETYPNATEGELARHLNRLVRGETCGKVGRALGLGEFLMLSESEAVSGGRLKTTILADAVEAVLGAVFLEAGYDKARDVVRRLWENEEVSFGHAAADPKSALQEWAQGRGLSLPTYVEVERTGPDHAPSFTSEVRIKGRSPARGQGASKRAAEQAAASAMLEREGVMEKRQVG